VRASSVIAVDDPVIAGLLGRLPRAMALVHSRRSFLEHLLATWRILADWRMPAAVCRAGFLHSAYSTSFYPDALFRLDERAAVRSMVGREAEELVFRFCTMDRRGLWDRLARTRRRGRWTYPDRHRAGAPVHVARKTLGRLLVIESANVAEQSSAGDGGPAPWMSRILRWWTFLDDRSLPRSLSERPCLTPRADLAAIEAYRLALDGPGRRVALLLDRAAALNPWAAEPRILRALCALETGDDGYVRQARRGASLLRAWAVPWDKRLTVAAWTGLARRVEGAARMRASARPSLAFVRAVLDGQAAQPRWLKV